MRGLSESESRYYKSCLIEYRISKWPDWKKDYKISKYSPDYDFTKTIRRYL